MAELVEIGNPIKFDKNTDPSDKINQKFRSMMKIADLIPVKFKFDFSNIGGQTDKKFITGYDFTKPMADYSAICKDHGLDDKYGGIRCWITGDTVATEEFTNNFKENFIESKIKSFSEKGQVIGEGAAALGLDRREVSGTISNLAGAAAGVAGYYLGPLLKDAGMAESSVTKLQDGATALAKAAARVGATGEHVSLPQVWQSSEYTPSLSLNIRLVSPYGSRRSIKKHVIEPLTYLLLLSSPRSTDGLVYGLPPYVYVNAYGIANFNLGYISGISINRGGQDVTYNKYRQPLFIDINLSLKPAIAGFTALQGDNVSAYSKVQMTKVLDYVNDDPLIDTNPGPGVTTVGNIIKSLRPISNNIETEIPSIVPLPPTSPSTSDGETKSQQQSIQATSSDSTSDKGAEANDVEGQVSDPMEQLKTNLINFASGVWETGKSVVNKLSEVATTPEEQLKESIINSIDQATNTLKNGYTSSQEAAETYLNDNGITKETIEQVGRDLIKSSEELADEANEIVANTINNAPDLGEEFNTKVQETGVIIAKKFHNLKEDSVSLSHDIVKEINNVISDSPIEVNKIKTPTLTDQHVTNEIADLSRFQTGYNHTHATEGVQATVDRMGQHISDLEVFKTVPGAWNGNSDQNLLDDLKVSYTNVTSHIGNQINSVSGDISNMFNGSISSIQSTTTDSFANIQTAITNAGSNPSAQSALESVTTTTSQIMGTVSSSLNNATNTMTTYLADNGITTNSITMAASDLVDSINSTMTNAKNAVVSSIDNVGDLGNVSVNTAFQDASISIGTKFDNIKESGVESVKSSMNQIHSMVSNDPSKSFVELKKEIAKY